MTNSTKETGNGSKNRYGLISMIAIIIGTVIGSGIYIKNSSLYDTTNSAIFITIGWIIGGLIVISMFIAFIEIISITTIKNEQGTFANWARNLWGEKTSKYIGLYFIIFYFPFIVAVEGVFASSYFNDLVLGSSSEKVVGSFFLITFISYLVIAFAFFLNTFFVKAGRSMQVIGTVIKTIPMFAVILIMLIVIAGLAVGDTGSGNTNEIFNPSAPINESHKGITSILLIIPPILFTLDGFLFAASASKEAKTPQTFKRAAIIAITFIILIYILFSLSSLYLGEYNGTSGEGYGIQGVIDNVFPNSADILINITDVILIISIVVATFGYAISSMWSLADASNFDDVQDKRGLFLRRNSDGIPYNAGMFLLVISCGILFVMRSFDGLSLIFIDDKIKATGYIGMSDFASNLFTTANFFIYSLLILGAVINRKTKKVEVKKVKGFFFFSFIAMLLMSAVILTSIYSIGASFFDEDVELYQTVFHLIIIVFFIFSIIIITEKMIKSSLKLTTEEKFYKKYFKDAYNDHIEFNTYFKERKLDLVVDENYFGEKINKFIFKLKEKSHKNKKNIPKNDDDEPQI